MLFEPLLAAIPLIRTPGGRRRKRPEKLHADKGYDIPRGWVVERTLAWLAKYRRLTIRYERRADIHQGFLSLGCALICCNFLGF